MPTSTRFVLSLHMLALVANKGGAPLRSDDIASSVNTNPAFVRAIFSRLAAAGLTTSQLGHRGGALLAREPRAITLLDVFRAVEDRDLFPFPRARAGAAANRIDRHMTTTLERVLAPVGNALEQALEQVSLDDVLDDIATREQVGALVSDH